MSTHKHFDRICCAVFAVILVLVALFMVSGRFGVQAVSAAMGYEGRLFRRDAVHTIDIVMEDWEDFIGSCTDESYRECSLVIDGEAYKNVAIRAKGNTSLTQVAAYGNGRYSFKIEFDHYDTAKTYYGLDKLCLNNMIQDTTYMKDYLSYRLMEEAGAAAPLCSYAMISVNGEEWGLYLAVEGVEEAFLQRNYGNGYGQLYKPDSMEMGKEGFREEKKTLRGTEGEDIQAVMDMGNPLEVAGNGMAVRGEKPGGNGMSMVSSDVLLRYMDDDLESFSNIFENAKTNADEGDKERLVGALKKLSGGEELEKAVDTDSVLRYFTAHNFVLNFDSYTGTMIHNYYLYEKDGQLSMIPWDYNLAFGGFESGGDAETLINFPIDTPVSGGSVEERPMLSWIFAEETYTEQYHQCFSELIGGYFESGRFAEELEAVKTMIAPYVEKDPTKFCTYDEFVTGIDTLKEFCLLRAESIRGQLDGTIGSTAEEQDTSTFVTAGDIEVSAMGTMNDSKGIGGGSQERPEGGGKELNREAAEDGKIPEDTDGELNREAPEGPGGIPGGEVPEEISGGELPEGFPDGKLPGNQGEMPGEEIPGNLGEIPVSQDEMFQPGERAENQNTVWVLTGISAGVLVLGILFALFFKQR